MGMHVVGFRLPDVKFKKMKAAWDACIAAGAEIPPTVYDFFNGEPPDERGVAIDLSSAVIPYKAEMRDGFEVHLDSLPKGIALIRFFNTY